MGQALGRSPRPLLDSNTPPLQSPETQPLAALHWDPGSVWVWPCLACSASSNPSARFQAKCTVATATLTWFLSRPGS